MLYDAGRGPAPACAELVASTPKPASAATAEMVTAAASTPIRP